MGSLRFRCRGRSGGAKCWRGTHATIADIAAAEKINESHVGRVLQLTLLAPDIVEAIRNGRQPAQVTLAVLMRPFAVEWREQWANMVRAPP
jgi:protein-arginine kinase activator protein McsA